jgi:hypothetical protein
MMMQWKNAGRAAAVLVSLAAASCSDSGTDDTNDTLAGKAGATAQATAGSAGRAAGGGSGATARAGSGSSEAGAAGVPISTVGNAGASSGKGGTGGAGGAGGKAGAAGSGGKGGGGVSSQPDAGAGSTVTYSADIQPILVADCSPCHSADGDGGHNAASSYADAVRVAARIVREINSGGMPDSGNGNAGCKGGDPGDPGCVSVADFALIQRWIAEGTPE